MKKVHYSLDTENDESNGEDQKQQQYRQNMFQIHQHQIIDDSNKESLSKVLRNIASMRRQQQQQETSSAQNDKVTSSTSTMTQKSVTMMQTIETSSLKRETTGGNELSFCKEIVGDAKSMMDMSACSIGKSMFAQHKQQQQSILTSSLSSISAMASAEAAKRTKTLSFLHNEDLLGSSGTVAMPLMEEKPLPAQSTLFRSMSFQERRQYQHQVSLKRVESGKELKSSMGTDNARKVTIISPKHSLHELNERIKHLQQQMYGSSESSL